MGEDITELLREHAEGRDGAFDELFTHLYNDLRQMARGRLAGGRPGSLDTTGLVHEAYLRLVGRPEADWNDRAHFFAVASLSMRSVIVDQARRLKSAKRGGDRIRVTQDDETAELARQVDEILAIHEALERLEEEHPRQVRIVEHRYFAGLTVEEAAAAMGVSRRTAQMLWARARDRLRAELGR